MTAEEKVNILLVDDQPAKLTSYEIILASLGENLVKTSSAREALEFLLKNDVAVLLVDVCMPDLDGFQLAEMVREHPRFEKTSIIFISAIQFSDVDRLRGYEMGGVDYVPVPVVPAVLQAKVKVFVDLYRGARQLRLLNQQLENRVNERTHELEESNAKLLQSEQLRSLALAAGQMGSWSLDLRANDMVWDEGQYNIFGVQSVDFQPGRASVRRLIHHEDWSSIRQALRKLSGKSQAQQLEFRVLRPNGDIRWCVGTVVWSADDEGNIIRMSGVTIDVTERKKAEEYQLLLAREVDHRARNMLAVVQSILSLTRSSTIESYVAAVDGRIRALSRAHLLLSQSRWQGADLKKLADDELSPYRTSNENRIITVGKNYLLSPTIAQTFALALHELATNAVKYGALSTPLGSIHLSWRKEKESLVLRWVEEGGPRVVKPRTKGYGMKVIGTSVERQMNGVVEFDWLETGLQCRISVPHNVVTSIEDGRDLEEQSSPGVLQYDCNGSKILVVEDEPLVALMMEEALGELGFAVIGPCDNTADALRILEKEFVNAAILDVHLKDEPSYGLADILLSRKIPFVFVTGFGRESIDKRFISIPVLQKPIDIQMALDALRIIPLRAGGSAKEFV